MSNSRLFFKIYDFAVLVIISVICLLVGVGLQYGGRDRLICFGMGLFFFGILLAEFLYFYKKDSTKVHKLTDMEWEFLKDSACYHLTTSDAISKIMKGNYKVVIKPTRSLVANLAIFGRSSAYFFLDKPSVEQLEVNDMLSRKDYSICVKIKDLDRKRIRIRERDRVLVYLGGYKGYGVVKKL